MGVKGFISVSSFLVNVFSFAFVMVLPFQHHIRDMSLSIIKICPLTFFLESLKLRPMETAWSDIENTLKRSKSKFKNLKEAMDWSRKRSH